MTTPSLRLLINARLLSDPALNGWNRYTTRLTAALVAVDPTVHVILAGDRPLAPNHVETIRGDSEATASRVETAIAPGGRGLVWEQVVLARLARDLEADLIHAPANYGLPWAGAIPKFLTLHDVTLHQEELAGPHHRFNPDAWRLRGRHALSRWAATAIVTPSRHAAREIVEILRVPAEKVVTIPEAADPVFHRPIPTDARIALRRLLELGDAPYLLVVGNFAPHKRVEWLLDRFAEVIARRGWGVSPTPRGDADDHMARLCLVLVGGERDGPQAAAIRARAEARGIGSRLRLAPRLSDPELAACYAEAVGLACPSRREGFGLPLVEAMAVGCPILAADATSLPEVLGSGGTILPWDHAESWRAALERWLDDPWTLARDRQRARERGRLFSWETAAYATLGLIRRLVGRNVPTPSRFAPPLPPHAYP